MSDGIGQLRAAIEGAVEGLRGGGGEAGEGLSLERPRKAELGDYSTNAAMLLAPVLGRPPREIAADLADRTRTGLGVDADRIEVAGPGFINLFLSERWYREALSSILAAGDHFGLATPDAPRRINVEFVSANPTGPLTAASGRHAAVGDAIARLLTAAGHRVEREFYLNDSGGQIDRFAASIAARMRGEPVPEDGYEGEYVAELGQLMAARGIDASDHEAIALAGPEAIRARIEATLKRFGLRFDIWSSERALHEEGATDDTIAELAERGHVYESESARWLRTTSFGDDKDRVLVKADGTPTYFAVDLAYHRAKLTRADRMVVLLGADHHAHPQRMKAGIAALGFDPDLYEAPLVQMVNLLEGGQRSRMAKRKGDFVTLEALIDDVGVDACRFLMLQRSHDSPVDLDLDLAREQSSDNPVYYVQYSHARICSIVNRAGSQRAAASLDSKGWQTAINEPAERELVKRLLELGDVIEVAASRCAPHRLTSYAMSVAADFNAFYRDCQVLDAPDGAEPARLALCLATRQVIATSLGLLGVAAPESM